MTAVAPFAIVLGVAASAALLWLSFAQRVTAWFAGLVAGVEQRAKQSNVPVDARKLLMIAAGCSGALTVVIFVVLHAPLVLMLLAIPVGTLLGMVGANSWLSIQAKKRHKLFMPQLEMGLRMMAGSLRVGLGLRQSIVVVTEELDDPAKTEFLRVVGRTNMGASILDALDELADRMPSTELTMTVRSIRVQSQTGGDLASLLDGVADMIKARRMVQRKVQALTSEGRMSGYVIVALPIGVGIFISLTQPRMSHALVATTLGHMTIGAVLGLEAAAAFVLNRMLKVDL